MIWAAFPLVAGKNLQKPASKSLLEMLQNTHKVKKIFCFYTENFHMKISKLKYKFVTYLRQVSYRKWYEMTAIYQIQIKKEEVYASFGWKLL
jgi:hypothetical protein